MSQKTALVLGATGMVGTELVKLISAKKYYQTINLLTRRPINLSDQTINQQVIDFDQLEKYADLFQVQDVYICLGTTIKAAKTKEAFRKVDYEYVVEAAKLAKRGNTEKLLLITAAGADPKSRVFYSRVKGEVEETLKSMKLHSLHIFRPSLLLGDRNEFRLGEAVMGKASSIFTKIMIGPLRPYRPIHAATVAAAMFKSAQTDQLGTHVYPSKEIERMGSS